MRVVVFAGSGEWSALYVDGKLDRVGDHYLIDERVRELLGVVTVDGDDFFSGPHDREHVAKTEEEVNENKRKREEREAKVEELRERAEALRRQADELEASI